MIGLSSVLLGFSLHIECDPAMSPDECAEATNACARVRQRGACAGRDARAESDVMRATIDLESADIASLRIEREPGKDALRRVLRFRPEDTRLERAKAMGLTLGVLAESLEPEERASLPEEKPNLPKAAPAEETKRAPLPAREDEHAKHSSASPVFEVGFVSRYEPGLSTSFFGGRFGVLFREESTLGFGVVGNLTHSFRAPHSFGLLEGSALATIVFHPSKSFPVAPALGLGVTFLDASVSGFGYHLNRTTFTSELSLRAKVATFGDFSLLLVPHLGLTPMTTTFSQGSAIVAELAPLFVGLHLAGTWSPR